MYIKHKRIENKSLGFMEYAPRIQFPSVNLIEGVLLNLVDEVGVSEHHSLGLGGGAGGVH